MDTLKEILAERLKAPLFGYIAISWVSYNWSLLAVLFMSKYPILSRIEIIKNTPSPFIHEVLLPILTGVFLTISMPYIQWLLSRTHFFLDSKRKALIKNDLLDNHENELSLISFKAELDTAYDLEKVKRQLAISKIEQEKKASELNIESLEIEKKVLEQKIIDLKSEVYVIEKDKSNLKNYIINSLFTINDILNISDPKELENWKMFLKEEFSQKDLDTARVMKYIESNDKEIAPADTDTIFQVLQDKIELKKKHKNTNN